jgi:hypothetical protein
VTATDNACLPVLPRNLPLFQAGSKTVRPEQGEMKMSHFISVRIWEPIQAVGRANRYEIPLHAALRARHWGEVIGSSSQMNMELEIESIEIELNLTSLDEAVDLVKGVLENAGAPIGSELRFRRDGNEVVIPFGTVEGLAVYLDGVNLPDYVYEKCTINELAGLLLGTLSSVGGEIRDSWVGRNETSIYMYGPNAETMFAKLEPILASYPLCQNARVVIRLGNPGLDPRTVHISYNEEEHGPKLVFWGEKTGTG